MTQEVESNQRPSRPLVLPETFDGERDFDEWISHFEDVADLNGWNDGEKLRWLKVRLVGKARVAFNRLTHVTQQSFATAKEALHNRFEPDSKRELYKVELERRKKSEKESWADYGDALSQLARKAFPNLQDEAREQLALNRYMDQLKNPQISFSVKQRRPRSIQEAVSATIELQSYLVKPDAQEAVCEVKEESAVATIKSTQTDIMDMMQRLITRVEQLETNSQRYKPPKPARPVQQPSGQRSNTQPVRCYRCQQFGHFARGCAMPDPSKQARGRDQETVTSIPEQSVQTMSINSVSSYT